MGNFHYLLSTGNSGIIANTKLSRMSQCLWKSRKFAVLQEQGISFAMHGTCNMPDNSMFFFLDCSIFGSDEVKLNMILLGRLLISGSRLWPQKLTQKFIKHLSFIMPYTSADESKLLKWRTLIPFFVSHFLGNGQLLLFMRWMMISIQYIVIILWVLMILSAGDKDGYQHSPTECPHCTYPSNAQNKRWEVSIQYW